MSTSPRNPTQRQRDYVKRLDAAGKTSMRLVVDKAFARQVHELAHANVTSPGDLLVKALAALQEAEALTSTASEAHT